MDQPLYPIFGADPDDDDDEGGNTAPTPNDMTKKVGKSVNDGSVDDDDGVDEDSLGLSEQQRKIMTLSKENKSRRLENKDLRKRIDEFEQAEKKKADENASELEVAAKANQELKAENSRLVESIRQSTLRSAILEDSRYTWQDVDVLVRELNTDAIDIDPETRSVDGLEDELKRIAEEKPFLVKKDNSQKRDGGGKSGHNPRKTQDQDQQATQREELVKKYKVLQGR